MTNRWRVDANERFCNAIEQHPLIYDHSHKNYSNREAYDLAWQEIAETIEEPVPTCKKRWRYIKWAFSRSLKDLNQQCDGKNKREKYYLHKVLEFLIPHIYSTSEAPRFRQFLDEMPVKNRSRSKSVTGTTIAGIKADMDSEVEEGNEKQEDDDDEMKSIEIDVENEADDISDAKRTEKQDTNEADPLKKPSPSPKQVVDDEKAKEAKQSEPIKRSPSSTSKYDEKEREANETKVMQRSTSPKSKDDKKEKDGDGDLVHAIRTRRKSRSVKMKVDENTDNTENEKIDESIINKKSQTPKPKIGEFYISPKKDAIGTFFIKKNKITNEAADATLRKEVVAANRKNGQTYDIELNENTKESNKIEKLENVDVSEDMPLTRRFRLSRACKRDLEKTIADDPLDTEKHVEEKRVRRSVERLKSPAQISQTSIKSIDLSKEDNKIGKLNETRNSRKRQRDKSLPTPIVEKSTTGFRTLVRRQTSNSTPKVPTPPQMDMNLSPVRVVEHTLPAKSQPIKQLCVDNNTKTCTTKTVELKKAEAADVVVVLTNSQAVQCDLQKVPIENDFFASLRPYVNEMNTRQKLHFKKKIYESLMEVFDSDADFPAAKKPKIDSTSACTTVAPSVVIPKQLDSLVSGEELSLVRELAALVQAAKQTPELIERNKNSLNNNKDSVNNNSNSNSNNNENNEHFHRSNREQLNNNNKKNENGGNSNNSGASVSNDSVLYVGEENRSSLSPATITPTSKPPPLLRVAPINSLLQNPPNSMRFEQPLSVQSLRDGIQLNSNSLDISNTSTLNTTAATSAPLTSSQTSSPLLAQRRVIRKVVKMSELGPAAFNIPTSNSSSILTNEDGTRRRLYRIYPRGTINNINLTNVTTSSSAGSSMISRINNNDTIANINTMTKTTTTNMGQGVRRIIIPSSVGNKSTLSSSSSAVTSTTLTAQQNLRQLLEPTEKTTTTTTSTTTRTLPIKTVTLSNSRNLLTPVTTIGWKPPPPTASRTSAAKSMNTINATVIAAVGARPIVRRYSVCGALNNVSMEGQSIHTNNILTTTANEKSMPSAATKFVNAVGRNSPANQNNVDFFKLPNALRNVNATTTTTASLRGKASVSVNDNDNSDDRLTNVQQQSTSAASKNSKYTSYPPLAALSTNNSSNEVRWPSVAAENREGSDAEKLNDEDFGRGIDFSNFIATDNFEVMTIKNEPLDF